MIDNKKVTGILVAAGRSARMGFDKLFYRINGQEIVLASFERLAGHPYIDEVVVVAGDSWEKLEVLLEENPVDKPCKMVKGGATRAESVAAGLAASAGADLIAIHDAARPFVSDVLISRTIEAACQMGAAAPAVPVKDTIKKVREGMVSTTIPRGELAAVQTPQVFARERFSKAFADIPPEAYPSFTDDCMVMEQAGYPVALVEGDLANRKITTQDDLRWNAEVKRLRVGHGYDVHRLVTGRALVLGGVVIPHPRGLLGHSDADVLCHAVIDALLGAVALGDIGSHFPDKNPMYAGASSLHLLRECEMLVRQAGYEVQNIDVTVLCESPKLAPTIIAIQRNISKVLRVDMRDVSIKATTEEGLGFTGSGDGISAHCVALLREC